MFYLLNKPKGISSFKAINLFAKQNQIKKIGHTGTLDPLATGLLLVATDADTKLISYVDQHDKRYKVTLVFGKISDTYDSEGKIKDVSSSLPLKDIFWKNLLTFEGLTNQKPPIFSAKKVQGQRSYKLARQGLTVNLKEKQVHMSQFELLFFQGNQAIFEVTVSRGTYIRSLVHDLGQKLGCGAIMTDLRRTKIGFLTEKNINQEVSLRTLLSYSTVKSHEIIDLEDFRQNFRKISFNLPDGIFLLKHKKKILGIMKIKERKIQNKKFFAS